MAWKRDNFLSLRVERFKINFWIVFEDNLVETFAGQGVPRYFFVKRYKYKKAPLILQEVILSII